MCISSTIYVYQNDILLGTIKYKASERSGGLAHLNGLFVELDLPKDYIVPTNTTKNGFDKAWIDYLKPIIQDYVENHDNGYPTADVQESQWHDAFESAMMEGGIIGDAKRTLVFGESLSVEDMKKWEAKGTKILKITEQDSTDFEKCIRSIKAPKFICLGFANERLDHFLAVCSALIKSNKPIFILGNRDLIFHLPTKFNFELPIHSRVSLYPLKEISSMSSKGLKYPLKGIKFSPADRIGTSNLSVCSEIEISA